MPTTQGVIEQLRSSRAPIATLDTPLEVAGRLGDGRRLLIKRDDLTGLGLGGNKARKAEMLCADALRQGADALVTIGAEQSNHARVTAAAGARCGLETHLVLGGIPSAPLRGNQLLSDLFGAHLHPTGEDDWGVLAERQAELVEQLRREGRNPYAIPMGGSSAVGASAFVLAWHEFLDQASTLAAQVGAVIVTTSTGGTHAGLSAGRALFGGPPIVGIDVAKASDDLRGDTVRLAEAVLEHLDTPEVAAKLEITVDGGYVGEAYAVPTEEADRAMIALARSGGWVLDRVYTAKGFAGLLGLVRAGSLDDGDVVFWHTGGQPAVFAEDGAPSTTTYTDERLLRSAVEAP